MALVEHEIRLLYIKCCIDNYIDAERATKTDLWNGDAAKASHEAFGELTSECYAFLKETLFEWAPHKLRDLVHDLHL